MQDQLENEARRALEEAEQAEAAALAARKRAEEAQARATEERARATESGHLPVTIEVRMTAKLIYDVLLYHMYSTFGGFCINIAGLTAVVLGGMRYYFGKHSLSAALGYVAIGIIMVVFTPLMLKWRAKGNMQDAKYRSSIHYTFGDNGIDEEMGNGSVNHYEWELITKAVSTPKTIAFYLSDGASILIFPKESFCDVTFREFIWHLGHHVVMGKIFIR